MMVRRNDPVKGILIAFGVVALGIMFFWITVFYVGVHFITKFW